MKGEEGGGGNMEPAAISQKIASKFATFIQAKTRLSGRRPLTLIDLADLGFSASDSPSPRLNKIEHKIAKAIDLVLHLKWENEKVMTRLLGSKEQLREFRTDEFYKSAEVVAIGAYSRKLDDEMPLHIIDSGKLRSSLTTKADFLESSMPRTATQKYIFARL